MSEPSTKASFDLHIEAPPHPQERRYVPIKTAREEETENARIVFDKTIRGHYRFGKNQYKEVGALFLTWEADDMRLKETEVDKLEELFATSFKFKTETYQIPSERWQIGLIRVVSDFLWKYDFPDSLAIIYYGGHGYVGEETKSLKFAAKFEPDGDGDPTIFFNDIRTCVRQLRCDQLMILDCCHAAKAFSREHIGRRKFELLTSAADEEESAAPHKPGSFTSALTNILKENLDKNPYGFSTSHVYRELYHAELKTKPLLFDQSQHSYGKIWLRPQVARQEPTTAAKEEGRYLNLTLQLNAKPDGPVMNELATHLQYLPYVDLVRFENLYAPRRQIQDFMKFITQAQKLRPLVRRLHTRRLAKNVALMKQERDQTAPPSSLIRLCLEHKSDPSHSPLADWSSAAYDKPQGPRSFQQQRKISLTWPLGLADDRSKISKTTSFSNRLFSVDYRFNISRAACIGWGKCFSSDVMWHTMMWLSVLLGFVSVCLHLKGQLAKSFTQL